MYCTHCSKKIPANKKVICENCIVEKPEPVMTLRDQYICAAITGLLAHYGQNEGYDRNLIRNAILFADIALDEREKK